MVCSESTKEISSALVKAQQEIKNLYPSSKGYGYDYVPLEKIIDMLKVILPKYGLSYVQLPEGGEITDTGTIMIGLTTRIIHESGEWIDASARFPLTDMKGVNKSQAAGASITYFRRYGLCAAFGITGDKDVDANDNAFKKQSEPIDPAALKEAKITLEEYLSAGAFASNPSYKKAAEQLLNSNDLTRINACIEECKKQVKSA